MIKKIQLIADTEKGMVDVMTDDTDQIDNAYLQVKGLIVTLLAIYPKDRAEIVAQDMVKTAFSKLLVDEPTKVINISNTKRND